MLSNILLLNLIKKLVVKLTKRNTSITIHYYLHNKII